MVGKVGTGQQQARPPCSYSYNPTTTTPSSPQLLAFIPTTPCTPTLLSYSTFIAPAPHFVSHHCCYQLVPLAFVAHLATVLLGNQNAFKRSIAFALHMHRTHILLTDKHGGGQLTLVFRTLYGQHGGPLHFVNECWTRMQTIDCIQDTRQVDQQRQA